MRDPEAPQWRVFCQVHDIAEEATHQSALGPVVTAGKNVRLGYEFDIEAIEQPLDLRLRIDPHMWREVAADEIGNPVRQDRQVARTVVFPAEIVAMCFKGIES